jgi:CubicO group peptidase (beta-lactamase class C family)
MPDSTTATPRPRRSAVAHRANGGPPSFADCADCADDDGPTVDTVVCVSSVSKPLVAACAGMLALDGLLDPDLPIRQLIPELPDWAGPVRVRHLVHHTSGLPDKAIFDIGLSGKVKDWTNETVVGLLARMPGLQTTPGTTFSYSSVGYICLTTAVERVSGQRISTMARDRIFTPLGMASTRFWAGPSLHPPSVTIHPPWHPDLPSPRTRDGLWSTARDLLRWADAMNTRALGEDLTSLLQEQGRLQDGTVVPYSWGAFVLTAGRRRAYAHGGWWPGCHTYAINMPASHSAAALVAFADDSQPVEALGQRLVGLTQT